MPVCLETSTRDPLPVKSSTMFEEMVYFYLGERVTLKTVSLQTDTRFKKEKKKSSESRSSISKRCGITLKNSLNSKTLYLKIKRLQLLEKRKCSMLSDVDYTNPKPQQYRHLA